MGLVSTKGVYGLCAMYELLISADNTPMSIKQISSKTGISQGYLEQLLSALKNQNIVKSTRGSKGGYVLAKKPDEIFIKDILIILEGSLMATDVEQENKVIDFFFSICSNKIQDIFDTPLSDLNKIREKIYNNIEYII